MNAGGSEQLLFTVYSPERKLLAKHPVQSVVLTGSEGQIQVLSGHENMLGTLETGRFEYVLVGGESVHGAVSVGFYEIKDNHLTVVAETLELAKEIDPSRAKNAQAKAEAILKDANIDEQTFRKYELKLQRALIRQHISSGTH